MLQWIVVKVNHIHIVSTEYPTKVFSDQSITLILLDWINSEIGQPFEFKSIQWVFCQSN